MSSFMTNQELEDLREFCVNRWPENMGVIHGVGHWDRVAKFGKMLYQEGADMDVIMCFAYLHDSERINNSVDDEHGFRASLFIDTIRDTYLKALSDEQIAARPDITRKTGSTSVWIWTGPIRPARR